ncbi:hypothetical protein [Bradyrhizobium valentinum]|uniref:hypothetical protein n=1 Tax=Bradyrhizobium valentinum TaxID=1518501 RepID=UPI000AF0F7E6|nr:hypothetical protein [Bradyrhizobium valentinum]
MAVSLAKLRDANLRRWTAATLTRASEFAPVAKRLVAAKARYEAVSARTGIPWPFIAVTHQRESSQSWSRSLAQGDPWDQVSTHVPKGRGPFKSWEDAAYDALVNCHPYASRNKDWSIAGTLTKLEEYNGLGYAMKGIPSPYLWSGTDQYKSGKYVRDGVFDANTVDRQLGCAGLLMVIMQLDPSIKFGTAPPTVAQNTATGAIVAGAVVGAQQAHASGFSLGTAITIAAIGIGAAGVVWLLWHLYRNRA